jgi:hypothetical protein
LHLRGGSLDVLLADRFQQQGDLKRHDAGQLAIGLFNRQAGERDRFDRAGQGAPLCSGLLRADCPSSSWQVAAPFAGPVLGEVRRVELEQVQQRQRVLLTDGNQGNHATAAGGEADAQRLSTSL